MRNKLGLFGLLIIFLIPKSYALTLNDKGQINATDVNRIVQIKTEADIVSALQLANKEHLPIAIKAKQHSQGGQTLANQAIVLDILSFNKVLNFDQNKKQITVESGITWNAIQKHINPYHLALKSMQSPNIFSVGGSIGVNAHGDVFRAGAVGNSIVAFHLLVASGEKVRVSPSENEELWRAVIGGYGLLGVVSDVTLQLEDDTLLVGHYLETDSDHLAALFREKILNDEDTLLFYAHVNIIPGEHFLKDMYIITYSDTHKIPQKIIPLDNPDRWNALLTPVFNLSRNGTRGKKLRWQLEQRVFKEIYDTQVFTRNNAMRKAVRFASDYHRSKNVDWLQEYFIPVDQVAAFLHKLRNVILKNKINLLNVTIRYVPAEPNMILSYAKTDCFSVVLYFNQNINNDEIKKAEMWTRELIDVALSLHGNYYLTYQDFATQQQFTQAYPAYRKFLAIKDRVDSEGRFANKFYETYLAHVEPNREVY